MNYKFDGDKVFFTSDTHFNHTNIIKFCQRPFKSTDEMNEAMITNWNNTVGEDDTVFHLGDFCIGGATEWSKILSRLNGKIYLILGNHDLKNIRQGFIERFYVHPPNIFFQSFLNKANTIGLISGNRYPSLS